MKQFDEVEELLAETHAPRVVEGPHKVRLKRDLYSRMTKEGTQMRNRKRNLALVGATLVVLLAATMMVDWVGDHTGGTRLAALDVLGQAAYAMEGLRSVHITALMRGMTKGGHFPDIDLDEDLQVLELWEEFGDPPLWRAERPDRVVVMDGQSVLLLSTFGSRTFARMYDYDTLRKKAADRGISVASGLLEWMGYLLDVEQLLNNELRLAQEHGSELVLGHEIGPDGFPKLVVTIEAPAQGDFTTSDYLLNKSIWESDNRRVYTFDAKTKLLENVAVYVYTDQGEVLVFELTQIEYDVDIDPGLFAVAVPEDAIWPTFREPEDLGVRYRQMQPDEVARAFFQACAEEDWDEALKFSPDYASPPTWRGVKDYYGGLEIITIGSPFQSGLYGGWFVPCKIRLKSGRVKEWNLALVYDSRARRYVIDGGI